ncbi:hypothetical protein RJT34_12922 [Clitoria ternatea]|uniref:Uncharacterized protein n=1 Tax=Clitoria ternatea TaxID=43366 RepID=A0AAN9PL87_CLITE
MLLYPVSYLVIGLRSNFVMESGFYITSFAATMLVAGLAVGLIFTVVDPHIAATIADAIVSKLCDENLCPREIFDFEVDYASHVNSLNGYSERASEGEGLDMERFTQSASPRCSNLTRLILPDRLPELTPHRCSPIVRVLLSPLHAGYDLSSPLLFQLIT